LIFILSWKVSICPVYCSLFNIAKIAHEIEAFCEKEKDKSNLRRLNKELSEVNKAIENLLKAIEQGQHIELLSERITQKQNEKSEIEKAIALEKLQYADLTASEIKFFLTRLKTGDIDDMKYRKMLITVLIHSVYLYDDGRLMITFNAGDKPITINTEQIADFEKEFDTSGSFLNDVGSPQISQARAKKLLLIFYKRRLGFLFWVTV